MSFRSDFALGVASASYQIEGALVEDGKGPLVLEGLFAARKGLSARPDGRHGANYYHRWQEEVTAWMKALGIKAYRFSISWPWVLPEGTGTPNSRGLDFYSRLIDALLAAGIEPWATLFHWTTPVPLSPWLRLA